MVFGNCGVLSSNSIIEGKGYVEMTSIDAETSQDIADGITSRGGRYLEAQVRKLCIYVVQQIQNWIALFVHLLIGLATGYHYYTIINRLFFILLL